MEPGRNPNRRQVQAQHRNHREYGRRHPQPRRLNRKIGGERIHDEHGSQQGQQHVVVRPANRRQCHHQGGGHRHLRQRGTAAFQLVQQAGGQHNRDQRQGVVDGLHGALRDAEVQQPTLNRDVIHKVQSTHTGGVRQRREPELRRVLRHQNEAQRNGAKERRTQGRDALPVAADQQNQTKHERGQLHAARNTNEHTARHAGCRAHKIGKNQRRNERVDLNQVQGALPRARRHHQNGQHRNRAGTTKVLLQGQFAAARIHIVVDNRGNPPRHHSRTDDHNDFADFQRNKSERQEQHRRERRVRERRLDDAVIVQGRGVQVLGEALVIENGHRTQTVDGEVHTGEGVGEHFDDVSTANNEDECHNSDFSPDGGGGVSPCHEVFVLTLVPADARVGWAGI